MESEVDDLRERLRRQETRTELILQAALEGFHIVGAEDARILDCNRSFAEILGYERSELLTMRITEIDARPIAEVRAVIAEIVAKGALRFTAPHRRKDGRVIDVEVNVHHVEADGENFFVAFSHPITDQLAREQALRRSEQKLRAMFDTTAMWITLLTPDGVVLECNRTMAQLVALDPSLPLWERSWWGTAANRERVKRCVEQAARGSAAACEVEIGTGGDDARVFDLNLRPSIDPEDQSVLVVMEGYEVTALRRAEAERVALQGQVIAAQDAVIREMSIPLIPLAGGVLVVPLIGRLDRTRAAQLLERLLEGVVARRASTVIIDVTGVTVVDTEVLGALLNAVQAAKLLGAQAILTGISPEIAHTIAGLDVDMRQIVTLATLQNGLEHAARRSRVSRVRSG